MSDQTPTPETDAAQFGTGRVSVDFARRLERERDESRADKMRIIIERERWRVKAEEKWAMRKELEEVLGVESAPASDEQFQKGLNRLREVLRERDEARAEVARLREDVLRWFAYIDPFELVDDDRNHFERWREEQALAAVRGEKEEEETK
jgi:hypothetical protein